jgi:hypothetical protein
VAVDLTVVFTSAQPGGFTTAEQPPSPSSGSVTTYAVEAYPLDDAWVARTAIDVQAHCAAHSEYLLVFHGAGAAQAPHLGFAMRAARRRVSGYVFIDPQLPTPGAVSDWPDAPVTVVLTHDVEPGLASAATLRGWTVRRGEATAAIREIIDRP